MKKVYLAVVVVLAPGQRHEKPAHAGLAQFGVAAVGRLGPEPFFPVDSLADGLVAHGQTDLVRPRLEGTGWQRAVQMGERC